MNAPFKLRLLLLVPVFTAIILAPLASLAQEKKVTAKVTDENGNALNGASIIVKGTNTGTNTDQTGSFSITVPNTNATLVISFSGYTPKETTVANLSTVVKLVPDEKKRAMDEVVVVGY